MDKMRVTLKVTHEQKQHIAEFARLTGLSIDNFCRQAILYSMQHALRRTNELHNSITRDIAGDTEQEQSGGSTDSSALSDANNVPVASEESVG